MVYSTYKIVTKDEKRGVWLSEEDLITLIRMCKVRNNKMYKVLITHYEFLEEKKFNHKTMRIEK